MSDLTDADFATGAPPVERARRETVKSADRTVDVLETLAAADEPMTLTELQRRLDVPKSSLHGLLRTLTIRGWVETDARNSAYRIGLRALRVGASFLDRDPVVQAAAMVLARLRNELDETVHLARLDGPDVVYLSSRESQHHLRVASRIGRRLPAHSTALGKALLATRPWDEVDQVLPRPLPALTARTLVDREELRAELAATHVRGWAHEVGENTPGIECYAVALPATPAPDAISCSVPESRITAAQRRDELIETLRAAADEIAILAGTRS